MDSLVQVAFNKSSGEEYSGSGLPWYALHTNYQHEKAAARILIQKGFDILLPLYDVAHRWKDRTKQLSLPLFPCYVFIQGGLDRRLEVLNTPGVFGFVGWAGRAAAIPEEEIEAVFKMIEGSLKVEPHPFLKCGDRIRVKSGPLQGIEGILVRKKNLFRLVLSVEMLQKSVAVEVDVTTVESVAKHEVAHTHTLRVVAEAKGRPWVVGCEASFLAASDASRVPCLAKSQSGCDSPGPRHEPTAQVDGLNRLDRNTPMKSKLRTTNKPMTLVVLLAGLLFLLNPAWAAQESNKNAGPKAPDKGRVSGSGTERPAPGTTVPLAKPAKDAYIIGPEDVLAINVWKEPEISRSVPVRPDGKISLPLVGDLPASGLTTDKLRDNIAEKLKEYISNPEVIVIVQEVKSRSFNIVGKVGKPGAYDLAKPMTVLDAIAVAGGFLDFAKTSKVYVLRRDADGSRKMLPFNYKLVIKGQGLEQNVELQPGDTVVVP